MPAKRAKRSKGASKDFRGKKRAPKRTAKRKSPKKRRKVLGIFG